MTEEEFNKLEKGEGYPVPVEYAKLAMEYWRIRYQVAKTWGEVIEGDPWVIAPMGDHGKMMDEIIGIIIDLTDAPDWRRKYMDDVLRQTHDPTVEAMGYKGDEDV